MNLESFVSDLAFPCVGAKTALSRKSITTVECRDLRCPADDANILQAVRTFVKRYDADQELFQSLVITFAGPTDLDEAAFETHLWVRLQALHALDAKSSSWDPRVASDPASSKFSFSLAGRAFYVIGMHPHSSRKARRFERPALILNLHDQFERLRETGAYDKMRSLIRRRDVAFSGSTNPMLETFGTSSEARQYSGRVVDDGWTCPFMAMVEAEAETEANSPTRH